MTSADAVAVAFAGALREEGVAVTTGNVATYVEALAAVDNSRRDLVYWAGRACLTRSPEDIAPYDRAFTAFFELGRTAAVDHTPTYGVDVVPAEADVGVKYSATEVLRHKDFAAYSGEEFAESRRMMADLRLVGALRPARRRRATRRDRGTLDVRRTARRAMRSGGVPVKPAYADTTARPRRVVVLCDVSGSMDPYARSLIRFLHVAVAGRSRVEAFAFGTRLTRISRELSERDPDAAVAAAARTVVDWSGGTRLGSALRAFNDEWGVRGLARGAVVVILSDGWDRGDPGELAAELARLRRVAHRIVWVNPLKASPGYAPLAQGMATALPYVDDFVEGHSVAALERLVEVVGKK
jgi:uncharacterized protein with von Willebrand factor type A (vWA) domain